ncbi:MAG: class I SAM-dependent methyltransferase [Bacteroidia bacterium]|nr:class I SAM-dependent methyltransferase [Bacteroidia bacterium]MDW8236618.1 class I SAM-dependent methyltransferase [Bacteroidia bacterium]
MWLAMGISGWRWLIHPQNKTASTPSLRAIEQLYRRLCAAKDLWVTTQPLGARQTTHPKRYNLASLVRRSATPPFKGKLLYDLVYRYRPRRMLELGTHVGIGTLYLYQAAPNAILHSVEGSPELAHFARQHFRLFGASVKLHIGSFAEILPLLSGPWDLVYIDGDHRPEAFLSYLHLLYPQLSNKARIICDDIFWSRDMYRAWEKAQKMHWSATFTIGPLGILQK